MTQGLPHSPSRPRLRLLRLAAAASDYAQALETAADAFGFAAATYMRDPLGSAGVLAAERVVLARSTGRPESPEEAEARAKMALLAGGAGAALGYEEEYKK